MSLSIDRIAPTQRPIGRPIGYQTWLNLSFLHWRVPADQLRPLLPRELELDTFGGDAWVGLVPFFMRGVRPWWSPAVPGISNFLETNLRTYVHYRGSDPGVWFYSLDAANALAVWIARTRWHLNYFHARMTLELAGDRVRYQSCRPDGTSDVDVELHIGDPLHADHVHADGSGSPAQAGTLEHFLAERYFLYSVNGRGKLHRGQVHHRAYPLRVAQLERCRQRLSNSSGIDVAEQPDHVLFSPGVTVEIFPLRPLEPSA